MCDINKEVGWAKLIFTTNGWEENKDIICNCIKPVVESMEKTEEPFNFFFLSYKT